MFELAIGAVITLVSVCVGWSMGTSSNKEDEK